MNVFFCIENNKQVIFTHQTWYWVHQWKFRRTLQIHLQIEKKKKFVLYSSMIIKYIVFEKVLWSKFYVLLNRTLSSIYLIIVDEYNNCLCHYRYFDRGFLLHTPKWCMVNTSVSNRADSYLASVVFNALVVETTVENYNSEEASWKFALKAYDGWNGPKVTQPGPYFLMWKPTANIRSFLQIVQAST